MNCTNNTFLPYQYEWNCVAWVYNVIKRKNELKKTQTKIKQKWSDWTMLKKNDIVFV